MMKKITFFSLILLFSIPVFSQPIIKSFSPASGPAGSIVTINGSGFGKTIADNFVFLGMIKAQVSAANDTSLKVIVPAGATFNPLTVTTNNLTAYSINSFDITYPGGSGLFTANSFLTKADSTTGNYPHSITLGDFNGDGKSDVLVSKGSSSTVKIYTNTSTPGNILFGVQQDINASGFNHEGSATADIDGDGKLDIIIVNSFNAPSVSVYKNISVGSTISFAAKIDYAAVNGPYNVALGDIDNDGKPDMVIANNGANVISFYKNTSTGGNISFAKRIDFTAGTNPYGIAIRDLDGDGKQDIAVTTQGSSNALLVLKNTTNAGVVSFDAPINVANLSGGFIVSIGDLDGDGKPDLATNSMYSITVVKNVSTPGILAFNSPISFALETDAVCVTLSDLDGDGKPDLITSNKISNNISALRNTSTPDNISFENHVDYLAGENPIFVVAGDLDGDGKPDIISANSSADVISIYKNVIGATIAPVITAFTPTSGNNGATIKITGINFTDVSTVTFGGVKAASFTVDSATGITAILGAGASGDVGVVTKNGSALAAGFKYTGPIIYSFTPAIGVTGTSIAIRGINFTGVTAVKFGEVAATSFTLLSDTLITAIVGEGANGNVSVTTINGTAAVPGFSFGVPKIISFNPSSGNVGSTITIKGNNFNAIPVNNIVFFGAVKAVVSSASATQLSVIVPAGALYMPISITTNSLTAFSPQPFIPTFESDSTELKTNSYTIAGNYATGLYPRSVAVSDLNDDGKPDLIIANGVSNNISVLQNTSTENTSFNVSTTYATGLSPAKVVTGDLNGDGKPDVVVVNSNSGGASTLSVFRNISEGAKISLAGKEEYSSGNGSLDVALADMDGDGKTDVIVTSGNSGFFSFFKNISSSTKTISFAPKQDFTFFSHSDRIVLADLNDDGKPDLVTSNFSEGTISIFKNQSANGIFSLADKIDYLAGSNPSSLTTADFDGDGKLDIILSVYSSNNILLFKNVSNKDDISFLTVTTLPVAVSNIIAADLNGDGNIDLFTGRPLSGIASILQNTTHNGNGSFPFKAAIDFKIGNYDTYVAAGDLNADGKPDLIVANSLQNTVCILKCTIGSPVISSLSVNSGGSKTSIIINGTNFTGVKTVSFGGVAAASFKIISSTKIDAIIGNGASGDVKVTNATASAIYPGFKFIPSINANGPLVFCAGKTVLLTSTAAENNQWYKNGNAIIGAIADTLLVNTEGAYNIVVTSHGITSSNDTNVVVKVVTIPTPIITKDANYALISSVSAGNQWYLNEIALPGETKQQLIPLQKGSYTVQINSNGCTSKFSAPFTFTLTGAIDLGNGKFINLYPNPVKNQLVVDWNIANGAILSVEINDSKGNPVFLNNGVYSGTSINLTNLPSGLYFIKFYNSQLQIHHTTRFIKQ